MVGHACNPIMYTISLCKEECKQVQKTFSRKTVGLGMPKKDGNKCWHPMQCTSTSLIHVDVELTAIGISMLLVCLWYGYKCTILQQIVGISMLLVCLWYGYKYTILQQIVVGINTVCYCKYSNCTSTWLRDVEVHCIATANGGPGNRIKQEWPLFDSVCSAIWLYD